MRWVWLGVLLWIAGCDLPGSPYDPARCDGSDEGCDTDGDGVLNHMDCAPEDAAVYPGAAEVMGNLTDSNCDGDEDDDGHTGIEDCNPGDPAIHPGAPDNPTDEVDSDCDGDLDEDGAAAEDDCDDADPAIHPGALDAPGDGIDSDCDDDLDDDGSPPAEDCDGQDPSIHPGAEEGIGDLIDSNCDGDADDDGATGENDCDESNPAIYVGATEIEDDLIDSDCDGDTDNDGVVGDLDCDPQDAAVYTGAPDPAFDGLDTNCDGDLDDDGALESDCEDDDPDIYPGAYDEMQDGVDSNCNGKQDYIYTLLDSREFDKDPTETALSPRYPTSVAVSPSGVLFFTISNWYKAPSELEQEATAQSGEVWMYDGTTYTHLAGGHNRSGACDTGYSGPDCFLDNPVGVATLDGSEVYFAVTYSNVILKVDTRTRIITRVAGNFSTGERPMGGDALTTAIRSPRAVTLDASGDVYFTTWDEFGEDTNFHAIFRVNKSGQLIHIAGAGPPGVNPSDEGDPAVTTKLSYPYDVVVSLNQDILFVDKGSLRIRSISPEGLISTLMTTPAYPKSLDLGPDGSLYYFLGESASGGDSHATVYRRRLGEGESQPIVGRGPDDILWEDPDYGDGVPALEAQLNKQVNLALLPNGGVALTDQSNYLIRYVVP